jgi:hypothetical protein
MNEPLEDKLFAQIVESKGGIAEAMAYGHTIHGYNLSPELLTLWEDAYEAYKEYEEETRPLDQFMEALLYE